MWSKWLSALVIISVFILDYLSKRWALSADLPISLFYFLGLHFKFELAFNTGMAWGIAREYGFVLFSLRLCLVAALALAPVFMKMNSFTRLSWALLYAGACANIVDYWIHGHVIDMISINFWGWQYPIFNIADSSICIGALLWLCSNNRISVRKSS